MRRCALLVALVAVACAPTLPRPYLEARAAAERAYTSGRYDEAAQHWRQAAERAERPRNRDEALYRVGACLDQAGRYKEAEAAYDKLLRLAPHGGRAPRAAYDKAVIEVKHGDSQKGYRMLEQVMLDYPRSGPATSALHRVLIHADQEGGPQAALAELDRLLPKLDKSELAERLNYYYARYLDEAGRTKAALARYLYTAKRFPYPYGAFWDDALYRASGDDEKLGNYRGAIAVLRRMLKEQEPSSMQGSYERPRYAPAQMRIAIIYRDKLHDPMAARRAFHKVWTDHPTSLLRDDALWDEATLAKKASDVGDACSVLSTLAHGMPHSRYVPCARELCPTAPPPSKGRSCHDYIKRETEAALEGKQR